MQALHEATAWQQLPRPLAAVQSVAETDRWPVLLHRTAPRSTSRTTADASPLGRAWQGVPVATAAFRNPSRARSRKRSSPSASGEVCRVLSSAVGSTEGVQQRARIATTERGCLVSSNCLRVTARPIFGLHVWTRDALAVLYSASPPKTAFQQKLRTTLRWRRRRESTQSRQILPARSSRCLRRSNNEGGSP